MLRPVMVGQVLAGVDESLFVARCGDDWALGRGLYSLQHGAMHGFLQLLDPRSSERRDEKDRRVGEDGAHLGRVDRRRQVGLVQHGEHWSSLQVGKDRFVFLRQRHA